MIKLPRLLDKNLNEVTRIHPYRVKITLRMNAISNGEMEVFGYEPEVNVGDFVELFVPGKTAGVFRVKSIHQDHVKNIRTIRMEHGLITLGDAIVPGRHEYFGWDDGDPETTITGYCACRYRYAGGSLKYAPILQITNHDGTKVNLTFRPATVIPVISFTDSGWRVPITQQLIDIAQTVYGDWDGINTTSLMKSDNLIKCTPYSNTTGTVQNQCDTYSSTNEDEFWRYSSLEKGDRVYVDAVITTQTNVTWYSVRSQENGLSMFVKQKYINIDDGYTIVGVDNISENQFEIVANDLISSAHKKDTHWIFGESDFNESFGYLFENVNLLDAILSLPEKLNGQYMWVTDQSVIPWKLNLRRLDRSNIAELRMNRNLTNLNINMDSSDVITCVLPIGKDGINVSSVNNGGIYVFSDEIETYWHAEKFLQTDDENPNALYESALAYLREHNNPKVNVDVSAYDLSQITGEPLDNISIGKQCIIPLPDRRLTLTETITSMTWQDVYGDPERITVTLANSQRTASNILASLLKK